MGPAVELTRYAQKLIQATGDRVKFSPINEKYRHYQCKRYGKLGRRPDNMIETIFRVPLPKTADDLEEAPANCFVPGWEASKKIEDSLEVALDPPGDEEDDVSLKVEEKEADKEGVK